MIPDYLKNDFDEICKGTIIPFFKEFGFKKKTLHFCRKINDITQCFNVQKGQWDPYHDIMTFTFNFGFYNSDISSIVEDKVIDIEFPKTYDCFIENRLGIFSHQRDHWYTISKNIDIHQTAMQIKRDLNNFLKPMFEIYTSLETLKQLINKDVKYICNAGAPYKLIAFYMLTNQQEKGRKTIIEHYKISLKPMTVTEIFVHRDGAQQKKVKKYINQHYIDSIKRLADRYEVKL